MTRAAFIRRDDGLFPLDDDGRALVAALTDKPVMIAVHARRNPRHHRLLFRLLSMVTDGGAWEGDRDSLLDYVKVATGHVRPVIEPKSGAVVYVTRSIAFDEMGQDKFRAWFDRAVFVICNRLLERNDWQAVRDEIVAAVDGPRTQGNGGT